ncbi:TonB-dependent receptor [Nonlabens sp. MB-3u-79]|uniref:TonB-dependent receptor n=1 Tax=Nonlabens sp. MB-3u-79 TaxID=2058134 RepID=UPI000C315850|nr:TonB-dependent receptor [Nonlabens sp. MB-3u-79]AUC80199.1 TonB-dependent receptor [Nonlabens sp. MB-3u-79]
MDKTRLYIALIITFLAFQISFGQSQRQKVPIIEVLSEIAAIHSVVFNYESSILKDVKVYPLPNKESSLSFKIENLSKQTNLVFNKVSPSVITISQPIKFCGFIYDASLDQPLLGATISGNKDDAISDANGYFEMELSSLEEVVSVRYIGFKTIRLQVSKLDLLECSIISMSIEQEFINTVLLEAYLVRGIDKNQDWTTSINYDKFSLLPGLIEADVLQTVQALPSIKSVDETVSNINIRGGSNDQNLILWDDIKMYQTGHFFGLISSFNPHMTQSTSVINNGTDVSFTDGVSGTIHMQTDKEVNSNFSGNLGVNFLNVELFSNIPIGNKSSLQVASRKSLDDFYRTPTYNTYFDRVTQYTEAQNNAAEVTSSDQGFDFYDTSLRWLYSPTDKDVIRVNFILLNNNLSFNETALFNEVLQTKESSASQNSIGAGINYKRQWKEDFFTSFSIYESNYKLRSINADVLSQQFFLQENTVSETSLKVENVFLKNQWQFKLGYSFTETEVINLRDIDLPRFVRRDEEVLREHGAFGQTWFTNAQKDFSVRAGIRANYLTKFNKAIIEPRLSVRKTLGDHFEMEALGEFKHQSTSQIINFQNDFLGIESRRWQLTDNDNIPIMESKQASLGVLYKNKGWLLDAKAYYKTVEGITTQSQGFTTKYEFERQQGSYDVYGAEFLLRKKFRKFSSWMSYSYLTNTYAFEGLEEVQFPSNFDLTHSFTMGSTYSSDSWNISGGFNYRTGKPTSIPLFGNEVSNGNVNFDTANEQRLRDYLRIDASAVYKFKINGRFRSEIGASLWNISNRENVINNFFRLNESGGADQFSRFSLGLTSNMVFRIYF